MMGDLGSVMSLAYAVGSACEDAPGSTPISWLNGLNGAPSSNLPRGGAQVGGRRARGGRGIQRGERGGEKRGSAHLILKEETPLKSEAKGA
eukprot:110836-Prorocentrum_minimum.AAC.2